MLQSTPSRVGAGLLGVLAVALALWWASRPADAMQASTAATSVGDVAAARSLQGTVPDGLPLPGALHALPDATATGGLDYGGLKRLFDYYLSTVGEQSVDTITQQIRAELDKTLDATRAEAAKRLLGRYLNFKRELVTLETQFAKQPPGPKTLRLRFDAMQTLRTGFFNAEEEQAMFGLEDAADMDALARLDIVNNPQLSATQKREQLAVVDAAMPKALREDREAPRAVIRLDEMAQALRAQGGSEDDVFRLRAKALDPAAATRLAEVDRDEQAWKGRIATYLAERNRLLQSLANASEAERQTALDTLQQAQFSASERPRLAAYPALFD